MTVAELIEELKKHDPAMQIGMHDGIGRFVPVRLQKIPHQWAKGYEVEYALCCFTDSPLPKS